MMTYIRKWSRGPVRRDYIWVPFGQTAAGGMRMVKFYLAGDGRYLDGNGQSILQAKQSGTYYAK